MIPQDSRDLIRCRGEGEEIPRPLDFTSNREIEDRDVL